MSIIGIYHGDCADGTGAAAVLLKKFPSIKPFPLKHHYTEEDFAPILEAVDENTAVYFVDFARGVERILGRAKEVFVIDHHIGVKNDMEKLATEHDNLTYIFDNEKSGATLAWKYFFGEDTTPEILRLIQDFDIWQWRFGDRTKYASNLLIPYANQPEKMLALFDENTDKVLEKGKIISEFTDYVIEKFVGRAEPTYVRIGEEKIPAFNTRGYVSEIGSELSEKCGGAVMLFNIQGERVHMSFRSSEGQSPTARELAETLGGGGHDLAAGAYTTLKKFCGMIVYDTNIPNRTE